MARDSVKKAVTTNQAYLRKTYIATLVLNALFYGYHFFFSWPIDARGYWTGTICTCLQLFFIFMLKRWAAPVMDTQNGDIVSCNALIPTALPRIQATFQDCLWTTFIIQGVYVIITRAAAYGLILIPVFAAVTAFRAFKAMKSTVQSFLPSVPTAAAADERAQQAADAVPRYQASDEKRQRRQDRKQARATMFSRG